MRPLHEFSRTSDVADAMNELIAHGGLRAPSQRQIASTVRLSPGTLMHEYGNRSEMLRRACVQVGRDHARVWRERRDEALRGRMSPTVLLPASATDLAHERLWAAWRELARGDVALLPGLGLGIEGERHAVDEVRSQLGREYDDRLGDTAHALLVGVITRMLDQDAPWSLDHAADVLAAGWT